MKFLIFTSIFVTKILSFKIYGDYYVENEGYIPATLVSEPLGYEAGLTRTQYNKLITGIYYFSRKVGPIGLQVSFERKNDGSQMGKVVIPNLCESDYPIEPFQKRFSGVIDDDCCVEKGNYTLTNWTLEDHLRPKIKALFYGRFTIHLCWSEKNVCIMEQDMVVVFKDRDLLRKTDDNKQKEAEDKEENKNQKRKSKGKNNNNG